MVNPRALALGAIIGSIIVDRRFILLLRDLSGLCMCHLPGLT
jgi:hypothetical protein